MTSSSEEEGRRFSHVVAVGVWRHVKLVANVLPKRGVYSGPATINPCISQISPVTAVYCACTPIMWVYAQREESTVAPARWTVTWEELGVFPNAKSPMSQVTLCEPRGPDRPDGPEKKRRLLCGFFLSLCFCFCWNLCLLKNLNYLIFSIKKSKPMFCIQVCTFLYEMTSCL